MCDDNKMWALREAAKPGGFCPNEASVAEFLKSLEHDGLLYRSEQGPFWEITPKGREELSKVKPALC